MLLFRESLCLRTSCAEGSPLEKPSGDDCGGGPKMFRVVLLEEVLPE